MISLENTPNNAGVEVTGDYKDFDALYESLHTIVGEEKEFSSYDGARMRVLGVCYDLRHAIMGNRYIKFVDNGMDEEKMRHLSIITSKENVYLSIHVLWPELLFVTMALNDFVKEYAGKKSKNTYRMMEDKSNIWDAAIANVKMFQSAIAKAIKETIPDTSYSRTINLLIKDYSWTIGYTTQYVDLLNCRFCDMDAEERLKKITIMAKRLAEFGKEYKEVRAEVAEAAKRYKCLPDEIRLKMDYPDEIDW
ncbi:DUF6904 family protein [Halobacillus amylolyticus]|uniref:Uncharacterized protein n=1 Tax=Halobacillus amylolyticus TaxID=2932259 RepID=A0ABY4H9Y1_9BACI|nr:hypothetical protein [Halobacillus amylolyticus]UOR11419.1 hypothetical protein MUO15_17760 [Halobacillus amylolyticus]